LLVFLSSLWYIAKIGIRTYFIPETREDKIAMIKLEYLTKEFTNVKAVDALNLHVKKGEIFGFLGPNGAGKTTTIRLITGILKPTSGRVIINDVDMEERPRWAKQFIGYVPDQPYLYERLSGREFIEFQAQLHLLRPAIFQPKLEELAESLVMKDWLDERIESYAQGMRQKTVMAAALIHDPPLIVLDEALVGLDPRSAKVFKDIIKQRSSQGTTIFFSTHILSVAQELCTRLAIIVNGKLITEGSLDELKERQDPNLEAAFLRITEDQHQKVGDHES
jgi:ABC-2 type transport system ATP-binding protein